jgi:ABC-2 type transport system permease protein
MSALFLRTIANRRTGLIVYCASGMLLLVMFFAVFPSLKNQFNDYKQLIEAYPEAMMKAFRIDAESYGTLEGFLAGEQFSMTWPIMLMFFVVSFAGSTIAGEIERGTMGLLLSQPITRTRLFFTKYLAGLTQLALFTLCTIPVGIPLARLFGLEPASPNYWALTLLAFLFGWAAMSLTFFLSALFSERGKVYGIIGGLFVLMYVLNILAALKENLKDFQYLSFFYYFDSNAALIKNTISTTSVVVFGATIVVTTILAAWWFQKRDVSV